MASLAFTPITSARAVSSHNVNASSHLQQFRPSFFEKTLGSCNSSIVGLRISNAGIKSRCRGVTCWFKFGKSAEGAGVYGNKTRQDFDRDDVEQYFNYMGMLAVEGTYDKMEALLNKNIPPIDILLLLAASEGDKPKIEELMQAGADYTVTDVEGRTALDRAVDEETKKLISKFPRNLCIRKVSVKEFINMTNTLLTDFPIKLDVKSMLVSCGLIVLLASTPKVNATIVIKMGTDEGNLKFVPSSISIASGEKITFINNKGFPHNVIFDKDGIPEQVDANAISHKDYMNDSGEQFTVVLKEKGIYIFYCEPHKDAMMYGQIIVN